MLHARRSAPAPHGCRPAARGSAAAASGSANACGSRSSAAGSRGAERCPQLSSSNAGSVGSAAAAVPAAPSIEAPPQSASGLRLAAAVMPSSERSKPGSPGADAPRCVLVRLATAGEAAVAGGSRPPSTQPQQQQATPHQQRPGGTASRAATAGSTPLTFVELRQTAEVAPSPARKGSFLRRVCVRLQRHRCVLLSAGRGSACRHTVRLLAHAEQCTWPHFVEHKRHTCTPSPGNVCLQLPCRSNALWRKRAAGFGPEVDKGCASRQGGGW